MVNGACLQMFTHYEAVRDPLTAEPWTYENASLLCHSLGGVVAQLDGNDLLKLEIYLMLWRHDTTMGDIWVKSDANNYNIIQVCESITTLQKPAK